jgi:hypothetical protein
VRQGSGHPVHAPQRPCTPQGSWLLHDASIGPNADSFYEYLVKGFALTGDAEYMAMFQPLYEAVVAFLKEVGRPACF